MRFGFVVPYAAEPQAFADLAVMGERAGWDAVFTWEALWGVDAWVSLAVAATSTQTIRLGTLLTPVSRWKPWDLASTVRTVDRLSNGRVILGAGLGALHGGWTAFEPDDGRRNRVERLEECLAIYSGLMAGQPFAFEGKHYSAQPTDFMLPAPPVQQPRPPVWLVGAHMVGRDRQPSLARAARWDGLLPQRVVEDERGKAVTIEGFADTVAATRALREEAGLPWEGYDVVIEADSSGQFVKLEPNQPAAWEQAGATWWVESWWSLVDSSWTRGSDDAGLAELRRRIEAGPPGV